MTIQMNTSSKAVECANCILGQAIQELQKRPDIMEAMHLSKTDIANAQKFRKSMLKAFFKSVK